MKGKYTSEEIAEAVSAIKRGVMLRYGDHYGGALVGVDVDEEDAIRYLDGATIDELLKDAR